MMQIVTMIFTGKFGEYLIELFDDHFYRRVTHRMNAKLPAKFVRSSGVCGVVENRSSTLLSVSAPGGTRGPPNRI